MAQKGPGFSSQSYSPHPSRGYPSLPPTNPDLLSPLPTRVDPQDQQAKTKEKDQMVGLNDKFVAFIDKVRHLEEQNKVLETRLKLLREQDSYKGKIDDIVKDAGKDMQKQIEDMTKDQQKLLKELEKSQDEVEDTRNRYEDEIRKRNDLENDFVCNKKDVDDGYLQRVALELELEDLLKKMDFLKLGYDEEIKELNSLIHNETVVVKAGNSRDLDMDEILKSVKAQYEEMASRSREEAEQWNKRKMDDLVFKAGRQEEDVKEVKREISEIQRSIQRIVSELDSLKKKKRGLEDGREKAELDGQNKIAELKEHIVQLDDALRRDKQLLAKQVREYQELMNLKLALDIEIATYKKLLEGEEMRLADHHNVKAPNISSNQEPRPDDSPAKAMKCLLIRIEVKDGHVISESSEFL